MKARRWLLMLGILGRSASACEGLSVDHAWVREGPPGAAVLAGYGTLGNEAAVTLRITAIESAQFRHVMLHETVLKDGTARMAARDSLPLAPGGQAVLAPGGMHLMLMHATGSVTEGTLVAIDFVCDGARTTLQFPVRRTAP